MRNLRFGRYLPFLVCLLAFMAGCQVLYRYRPVPVLVRDAETKKPIADAEVHLSYPLSRDSLAPFDSSERTGPDGIAHLRAAPYGDFGVRLDASAPGYMAEQQNISTEKIQKIEPAHFFETAERRPPECVVEMYAEPRFTVELIVPAGYRGLIKAEVQIQDDIPVPPGQRCFRYEVADGFVQVKGPGVLRRIPPPEYHARYADGTPLANEMTLLKVGFRWLRGEGKEHYFVVGTQPEYDMQRRYAPAEQVSTLRRAEGPSNGGHGRRHRGD
jgi:hypothetical protein